MVLAQIGTKSIILFDWADFIKLIMYPFKVIFAIMNLLDNVYVAKGLSLFDISVTGIVMLIVFEFLIIQTKGR